MEMEWQTETDSGKLLTYRIVDEETEWQFRSDSNGRTYTVLMNGYVSNKERIDNLSCNCPGWVFHGKRWCKHTRFVMKKMLMLQDQLKVVNRRKILQKDMDIY